MPESKAAKPPVQLADFLAYEPSLIDAHDKVTRFIQAIRHEPYSDGYCLTLCGKSGTGKSMLARCVLTALRFNRWGACEVVPVDMVNGCVRRFTAGFFDMRRVSDGFKNFQFGVIDDMETRSLTIMDDVGADHDPSKVTASKVDRILRSRANKWTLVTINLPLAQIAEQLDARIASFIIRDENRFVEIQAPDFAMRKFKK